MRRTLAAILCTVLWLFVGQMRDGACGGYASADRPAVQGSITDSDRGTLRHGGDDVLSPASEPVAVERSGGAVSARGAARRTGHNPTKIFTPEVADGHAGRVTNTLDFGIRRPTLCAKRYLHVLRRLRI